MPIDLTNEKLSTNATSSAKNNFLMSIIENKILLSHNYSFVEILCRFCNRDCDRSKRDTIPSGAVYSPSQPFFGMSRNQRRFVTSQKTTAKETRCCTAKNVTTNGKQIAVQKENNDSFLIRRFTQYIHFCEVFMITFVLFL